MSAKHSTFFFVVAFISLFIANCHLPDPVTLPIPSQKSKIVAYCEVTRDTLPTQWAIISRTTNLGAIIWDFKKGDTLIYPFDTTFYFINHGDTVGHVTQQYPAIVNDGTNDYDYVKGAKAELFEAVGHKLYAEFYPSGFLYGQSTPYKNFMWADSISPEEGKAYTLQISAPGYDTITSTQTAPRNVFLDRARFIKNGYSSATTGTLDVVELTFQDPSLGQANYYAANVFVHTNVLFNGSLIPSLQQASLTKIDPNATNERVISDMNFVGQQYVWRIGINLFGQDTGIVDLHVQFQSTTKDYNTYVQAQDAAQKASGDPFAEPITPFTNFKNGLGLFVITGKLDSLAIPIR